VRLRWLAPLALVAALTAGIILREGGSEPHRHPPAPVPRLLVPSAAAVAGLSRISYSDRIAPADASRYRELVLQYGSGIQALVAAIHHDAPRVRVLLYQDVKLARADDVHGYTVCETPQQVTANPGWLLRDPSGGLVAPVSYPGDRLLDVADPGFERVCGAHALGLARAGGFDGVYFDDLSASPRIGLAPAVTCLRPLAGGCLSDADWQGAMVALVSYLASQMHAHHLLAYGNIGGATGYPGLWARLAAPLNGAEEQAFGSAPGGGTAIAPAAWRAQLAEVAWSEAHGRAVMAHSYATTEAGTVFGLASLLLVAGGHSSWSTSEGRSETLYPEYAVLARLGAPAGPYATVHAGAATVYRRAFAHGLVLVDPPGSPMATVALGATYAGVGAEPGAVRAVTLGPGSGLILLREG
jgi:hypothetical protein